MIRLFAALPVPSHIAEGLARRQQGLPRARWSPAETLHITLCFFDEVSEATAADLDLALAAIVASAFPVSLRGVGAFGPDAKVRSVWAGAAPSEPLSQLAARCVAAARRCGVRIETRAYRPHVTLAYLRASPPERVAAWIQDHNLLASPSWRVDAFALYSSWRSPEGSRYELERSYPLRGVDPAG